MDIEIKKLDQKALNELSPYVKREPGIYILYNGQLINAGPFNNMDDAKLYISKSGDPKAMPKESRSQTEITEEIQNMLNKYGLSPAPGDEILMERIDEIRKTNPADADKLQSLSDEWYQTTGKESSESVESIEIDEDDSLVQYREYETDKPIVEPSGTTLTMTVSNGDDLKDIINSKYGWAIANQFEDILNGEELEAQNTNALIIITEFLDTREDDGAEDMADEIRLFLHEKGPSSKNTLNKPLKDKIDYGKFSGFDEFEFDEDKDAHIADITGGKDGLEISDEIIIAKNEYKGMAIPPMTFLSKIEAGLDNTDEGVQMRLRNIISGTIPEDEYRGLNDVASEVIMYLESLGI